MSINSQFCFKKENNISDILKFSNLHNLSNLEIIQSSQFLLYPFSQRMYDYNYNYLINSIVIADYFNKIFLNNIANNIISINKYFSFTDSTQTHISNINNNNIITNQNFFIKNCLGQKFQLNSSNNNYEDKEKNKENIFEVINQEKGDLFNISIYEYKLKENNFDINKRSKIKKKRFENQDNIRKKIKRAFFNNFLLNKINYLLRKGGSIYFFEKFPQNFVSDISKISNQKIINFLYERIILK